MSTHMQVWQNKSFHTFTFQTPVHAHFSFICLFVCFPQIDQGRICVCVRKRPLSKQGKVEVFYSVSPEVR